MHSSTIRDRLFEVAQKFTRVEFALFTTFNFNADFFEQNVLPTVFGVDVRETSRRAKEQAVHKHLAESRAAVFYDPSAARPSKTAYRYAAHPVFLGQQRLFHPKCIFIAGTDSNDTLWLYIAVMSANLSLSGWGRNCEGFSDIWVHTRSEQPAAAAIEFLGDLAGRLGQRTKSDGLLQDLLTRLGDLHDRRCKQDPEDTPRLAKDGARLYFSPLHPSLWSFVHAAYKAKIEKVQVASPYWGEGTAIKAALGEVPLQLIASRRAPQFDVALLGKDTLGQLGVREDKVQTWSNDDKDRGRFFHIKLYRIAVGGRVVTGTGSCNFTSRGLMWRTDGVDTGNVECMLFNEGDFDWPKTMALQPACILEQTDNQDAPQAWPVYVHVQYDWEKHRYSWDLDGRPPGERIELQLPDQSAFVELDEDEGSRAGVLKSREFKFRWREKTYVGIVAELKLAHSDRLYGTLLTAGQILDSWRSGAPSEPPLPDSEDEVSQPSITAADMSEVAAKLPPLDEPVQPFDWFLFFRCVLQRRERIDQVKSNRRDLLELLVTRTDSAARMAAAAMVDAMPPAGRWIVVHECLKLLKPYRSNPEVRAHLKKIEDDLDTLRKDVTRCLAALVQERRLGCDPADLLAWYELKLRSP